eukprot:g7807.t1
MRRACWLVAGTAGGVAIAATAVKGRESRLAVRAVRLERCVRPLLGDFLPLPMYVWLYSASAPLLRWALAQPDARDDFAPPARPSAASAAETTPFTGVRAMGLCFRNDLGNAAGFDKDGTLLDFFYRIGAGFAVVGTVVSAPHPGNVYDLLGGLWSGNVWVPLPRAGGSLNSLGLPSRGVDAVVANVRAFRRRRRIEPGDAAAFPIGVSVMGHPGEQDAARQHAGVLECVRKALPVADFIEVNESCPNVAHAHNDEREDTHRVGAEAGVAAAARPLTLARRLADIVVMRDQWAAESGRRVPLLIKLGATGDAETTVSLLRRVGADGVILLNTQKDYDAFDGSLAPSDVRLLRHYTERFAGGLSGRPVLPRSTASAAEVCAAARRAGAADSFTVVHVGGIASNADVRCSRATGAQLRQWYTGLMHGIGDPQPLETLYPRVTAAGGSGQ